MNCNFILSSILPACLFIIIILCIPLISKSKILILIFSHILQSIGFILLSIGTALIINEIVYIIYKNLDFLLRGFGSHNKEYSIFDIIIIILFGAIIYYMGILIY